MATTCSTRWAGTASLKIATIPGRADLKRCLQVDFGKNCETGNSIIGSNDDVVEAESLPCSNDPSYYKL